MGNSENTTAEALEFGGISAAKYQEKAHSLVG
jgi:hypothetical protein